MNRLTRVNSKWINDNKDKFRKLRRHGNECTCCSPLRKDGKPSFTMNIEKGVWHDFATNEGGTLKQLAEKLSVTPPGDNSSGSEEGESRKHAYAAHDQSQVTSQMAEEIMKYAVRDDDLGIHPYLLAKGLANFEGNLYTLKKSGAPITACGMSIQPRGQLVVPMRTLEDGRLTAIELISAAPSSEGQWHKLTFGHKEGAAWTCKSKVKGAPFVLCEGMATAASIAYIAPEFTVLACGGVTGIQKAAQIIRKHNKNREIIIATDYDDAGENALIAVRGDVKHSARRGTDSSEAPAPDAIDGRPSRIILDKDIPVGSDWNDIMLRIGSAAAAKEFRATVTTERIMKKISESLSTDRGCFFPRSRYTEATLMSKVFEERPWPVENLIPYGLSLLAGHAKKGKSWIMHMIGRAVSSGQDVFGLKTHMMPVLYCALEDTERRMQERTMALAPLQGPAPNFEIIHEWSTLDHNGGGMKGLVACLVRKGHSLVIIDTWAKLVPDTFKNCDAYKRDSKQLTALKLAADLTGSAIVIVTHFKKGAAAETESQEKISGSLGQAGTVDAYMCLLPTRREGIFELTREGKDYTSSDSLMLKWMAPGFAVCTDEEAESVSCKTLNDQVTECILRIINSDSDRRWTPKEIYALVDIPINDATKYRLLCRLVDSGAIIRLAYGKYTAAH